MPVLVSLLLTGVCVVPAAGKLIGHPRMRHAAAQFGIPWPKYQLIAIPELAAAGGLLAGLVWPPVGVAAAIGMVLLLLAALVMHRRANDTVRDALPALIALAVCAVYLVVATMA